MRRVITIAALMPLLTVGCLGARSAGTTPCDGVVRSSAASATAYTIGCPDVLAVRFADSPQHDCLCSVDLDGRLPLSDAVRPRVEGGSPDDARRAVAAAVGCDPTRVSVTVADARTGRVYLFGPEQNRQRVVPHIGAERLVDFLHRSGCSAAGCADWRDVCVVRPNVASGGDPQVFRVDLRAVSAGDHTTNVTLEPGDQVYVGETRRSSFSRLLPDWLKPGYFRMTGMSASDTGVSRR